jgi:hypothetical protein
VYRELDELEREDFTRLKKVQANKVVAAAIEKEEKSKAAAVAAAAAKIAAPTTKAISPKNSKKKAVPAPVNLLKAEEEEDVYFEATN